jgi:hypothetical protein
MQRVSLAYCEILEKELTSKGCGDEYGCKASDSADKWGIANVPVMSTDVFVLSVSA